MASLVAASLEGGVPSAASAPRGQQHARARRDELRQRLLVLWGISAPYDCPGRHLRVRKSAMSAGAKQHGHQAQESISQL